jgi:iron complex outermembrane recepter protein
MTSTTFGLKASVCCAALMFSSPALAQTTNIAGTNAPSAASEVVIVTAQRRAQDIQQVPASVTALGTSQLEQRQVAGVLDLQYQVPNISIATGTGTANSARIFLRGVGEDESRGAVDPAVAVYVDGIYMGRQLGSLFSVVDLERIEVLRGPQGTLYGRASNGGAIKLVSKRPNQEFGGELRAGTGNYDRAEARATINLPLADATAVRLTAVYKGRDGFHTLLPNGDRANFARNVGAQDMGAFRFSLAHDFSADWKLLFAYDSTRDNGDPTPDSVRPGNDRDNNLFTIEPLPGVTCGPTTTSIGCFSDYRSKIESDGGSLNIEGKLGSFSIQSLTGYRTLKDDLASRIGSPYFQKTDQDQFSQEITLSSNFSGPFNFVAGAYLFNEDVVLNTTFVFPFIVDVKTESVSGFVHGTFEASDKLTATAGVRVTQETKDFFGANLSPLFSANPAFQRTDSRDFDNTSYNVGLDYDLSDTWMVYGSYATGFKPGGWSPDCFSATACFLRVDPEEVATLEVGTRTQLFDKALKLNATYFFNTYEGLQIGATVPGLGFTRFNVAETEIQGLEFEAFWRLSDHLSITSNVAFLDAEYTSVTLPQASALTNAGVPCAGGVPTIECALALKLKNAPDYKGFIGLNYTRPMGPGALTVNADVAFEDDSFSLVANTPINALTSVDPLYNARISYAFDNGVSIAVWGQNLTDEQYWRAASAGSFTTYAAPPLTWGVDLGVKF